MSGGLPLNSDLSCFTIQRVTDLGDFMVSLSLSLDLIQMFGYASNSTDWEYPGRKIWPA